MAMRDERVQALAEHLHSAFCSGNHTDYCDWFYGSWDLPTHAHRRYYMKAIETREAVKVLFEEEDR